MTLLITHAHPHFLPSPQLRVEMTSKAGLVRASVSGMPKQVRFLQQDPAFRGCMAGSAQQRTKFKLEVVEEPGMGRGPFVATQPPDSYPNQASSDLT